MSIVIDKVAQEMLNNLYNLEVQGIKPFIEHDDKTFIRFNKITIEQPRPGLLVATYYWRDVPVVHIDMESIDVLKQVIILEGMYGELEYTSS